MNYSTYAIDCLNDLIGRCTAAGIMKNDCVIMSSLVEDLKSSVKYLVPPPTSINVIAKIDALNFLRLPYPIVAFEYSIENALSTGLYAHHDVKPSSRRVALAYDVTKDTLLVRSLKNSGQLKASADGILVISLYQNDATKEWFPSVGAGYIDRALVESKGQDQAHEFFLSGKTGNVIIQPILLLGESLSEKYSTLEINELITNDVIEELSTAVRVTLLLNSKNLKQVNIVAAPHALNKKRAKSGKTPFYSYKTLDIFVTSGTRKERGKINYGEVQKSFTEFKQKFHSVAGHLKVRKTGVFWWNNFVRGNKDQGIVDKDYSVK